MRVRAKATYYYGGRQYEPGEEFDMAEHPTDAGIRPLLDLGTLELVGEQPTAPPPATGQAAAPTEATGRAEGGHPMTTQNTTPLVDPQN